jgi:hypothetical protein
MSASSIRDRRSAIPQPHQFERGNCTTVDPEFPVAEAAKNAPRLPSPRRSEV